MNTIEYVDLDPCNPDTDVIKIFQSDIEEVMLEHPEWDEDMAVDYLVEQYLEQKENV